MNEVEELQEAVRELQESEGFHIDSRAYKNMRDSIRALADKISELRRSKAETQDKNLSEEERKQLSKVYKKAVADCKSYVTDHKKESHSTERGAIRQEIAERMYALIGRDALCLSESIKAKELSLDDVFTKSRSEVLKIDSKNMNTVGANMSSRIPIAFTDKNGVKREGFFTRSDEFDPHRDFLNKIEKVIKENEPQVECAIQRGATLENYNRMVARVRKEGVALLDDLEASKDDIRSYFERKSRDEALENPKLVKLLKKFDVDVKNVSKDELDAIDFFLEDLHKAKDDVNRTISVNNSTGIRVGDDIANRNVAMSIVAEHLGISHLLAKSQQMTLEIDGNQVQGVFMEKSTGIDPNAVAPGDPFTKLSGTSAYSSSYVKASLAALQMLDYICGNTDRHQGNLFIKLGEYDGKTVVKGIEGIDNDCSFGTIKGDKPIMKLITPDNMTVINEGTAQAIEATNVDELKIALYPAIKNEEQLDAFVTRFNNIKQEIKKGREAYANGYYEKDGVNVPIKTDVGAINYGVIRVVGDGEWKKYKLSNLAQWNPDRMQQIREKAIGERVKEYEKLIEKKTTELSKAESELKNTELSKEESKEKQDDIKYLKEELDGLKSDKKAILEHKKAGVKWAEDKKKLGKKVERVIRERQRAALDNAFNRYPAIAGETCELSPRNITYTDVQYSDTKYTVSEQSVNNRLAYLQTFRNELNKQESTFHSGEYKQMKAALNEAIKYSESLLQGTNPGELKLDREKLDGLMALNKKLENAAKAYAGLKKTKPSEKEVRRGKIAEDILKYTRTTDEKFINKEKEDVKALFEERKERAKSTGMDKSKVHEHKGRQTVPAEAVKQEQGKRRTECEPGLGRQ